MAGMMGTKMSPKVLMARLYQGALEAAGLFHVLFGAAFNPGDGNQLVVHLVHRTGADDDLQLAGGLKDALDAVYLLHLFFFHFAVVRNHQPQPGGTVGRADDVFRPANQRQDGFCRCLVIHGVHPFFRISPLAKPVSQRGVPLAEISFTLYPYYRKSQREIPLTNYINFPLPLAGFHIVSEFCRLVDSRLRIS